MSSVREIIFLHHKFGWRKNEHGMVHFFSIKIFGTTKCYLISRKYSLRFMTFESKCVPYCFFFFLMELHLNLVSNLLQVILFHNVIYMIRKEERNITSSAKTSLVQVSDMYVKWIPVWDYKLIRREGEGWSQ